MKNQKVDTKLGVAIIVIFAITAGVSLWNYRENDAINSEQQTYPLVEKNNALKKEMGVEISDKWTLVSHYNFWNNPNIFNRHSYSFPNIEFSYPDNWDFSCCGDTDYGSDHFITPTKILDDTLPYIHIIDHSLKGCPGLQKKCSLDKTIKITATDKFNNLISNISTEAILPKIKLEKLNTSAFVYKKLETNNKPSKGYIINLGDRVIEVDFVNYELLDEKFIENFLNHIELEN